MQVDLGRVERPLAFADHVLDPVPLERGLEDPLGVVPLLVGAEPLLGSRRQLRVRRHPEERIEILDELDAGVDLAGHLLLGAEDVRVVLGDVADAQKAVQRAGELVPVQGRALGVADRKVSVAAQLRAEQEHVPRAVHRLQRRMRLIALAGDEEHVLAELLPVAARDPDVVS